MPSLGLLYIIYIESLSHFHFFLYCSLYLSIISYRTVHIHILCILDGFDSISGLLHLHAIKLNNAGHKWNTKIFTFCVSCRVCLASPVYTEIIVDERIENVDSIKMYDEERGCFILLLFVFTLCILPSEQSHKHIFENIHSTLFNLNFLL